jgi:rare lipoprotein A
VEPRIIDLSHAAAREIEMIGPGTARVRLTIIAPPAQLPSEDLFSVQVGAFRELRRAELLREDMHARFGTARIVERAGNPTLWRVLVGEEPDAAAAATLAARIEAAGVNAFVVRLDPPAAGRAAR